MPEKIIRDPVHDVISFQLERPADALLFRLINAREVQRLRRIRQLGMASLAYPGADHSRYSHSIGVMQTARLMLEQLGQSIQIESADSTACVAAALLHDLGHGPFSHVFERVNGLDHEEITCRIIQDTQTDVYRILAEHNSSLPSKVVGLLSPCQKRNFLSDILSSQLDADRFDYLLRDNLMTGSRYGAYDLQWLLHSLLVDEGTRRLAVAAKGVSAVEAYLQSRYHMYRNVYFHKVVRTAEGMMLLILKRAKRLAVQGRLPAIHAGDVVYKSLVGQNLSDKEFNELDDVSVLYCLKAWCDSDDATLARLCTGLLNRRLFKTIDISSRESHEIPAAMELASHAITDAGGDAAYSLFYDEPSDTPYEIFDGQTPSADILVRDKSGKLASFAAISPMTQVLSKQLMFRRLHVAEEFRDVVQGAISSPKAP